MNVDVLDVYHLQVYDFGVYTLLAQILARHIINAAWMQVARCSCMSKPQPKDYTGVFAERTCTYKSQVKNDKIALGFASRSLVISPALDHFQHVAA